MKSIIIENLSQYNLVKNKVNLKNINIITLSPAVSLILKEKKIKHDVFNIDKVYFQLHKDENILNKKLYEYLIGLENFGKKKLLYDYKIKK